MLRMTEGHHGMATYTELGARLGRDRRAVPASFMDQPEVGMLLSSEAPPPVLERRTEALRSLIVDALGVSPYRDFIASERVTGRLKTQRSVADKIGRRLGEGPYGLRPLSDLHAIRIVLPDGDEALPWNVQGYLRDFFGMSETALDGGPTIAPLGNGRSHPEFPELKIPQAKLGVMLDGQAVLFEVLAMTETQWRIYQETHDYYERNRLQRGMGGMAYAGAAGLDGDSSDVLAASAC